MSLLRSLRGVTALAVFAAAAWGQQPSSPRNVPNHTPSAVQSQPDIFTPTADAKLAVDNALQSAQNAGRRVLVVYGGVWCAQCPALQKIIESAPDTAPMVSQGFVTV